MLFNDDVDLIKKYTGEMLEYFKRDSRLEHITTLKSSQNIIDAIKFEKKYLVPKDILNGMVIGIFSSFMRNIQMSEFQYVINQLKKFKMMIHNSEKYPDRTMINNAINRLLRYTKPNFMIVPIQFFVDMHDWGMRYDKGYPVVLKYQQRMPYYLYRNYALRIMWSNKFIDLKEIIIGNNSDSKWLFKPDKKTKDRITIEFERDIRDDVLLIRTIFKFIPPNQEYISIIRFDDKLFENKKRES